MSPEQSRILILLESGHSVTSACRSVNTTRTVFYAWLKDDKEFREAVAHSDLADIITIEDVLFVKAMSGSAQDRKLYFERRERIVEITEPQSYVDRQLEMLRKSQS